jgi:hypothetical protein
VRASLLRETGKTLDQWAELARACPETAPRKRQMWLRTEYGLGINYASLVLNEAFPSETSWETPEALADNLWRDPSARSLFDAIRDQAASLPDLIVGQRKTFTALSRNFQFAAMKPVKQSVLLGLAVAPDADPCLVLAGKEAWSERLKSKMLLSNQGDIDEQIGKLLRASWEIS